MAVALERTHTLSGLAPETRCLYDIYKKEGDDLYCKRRYKKALISYNEALRLVQRNPQTLVARSRCYMGIGMMQRALEDAEGALDINASYLPAIYQKGQILYRQGNYEMAMLTFNRGHKLNASAPGFLEGIQKAQHAMDIMATGRHMKTTPAGDLSMYIPKKQSSFQLSKRTLPTLGKSSSTDNQRLPSPGFRKRHGTLLLQVQKRHNAVLGHPKYGHVDKSREVQRNVNDKAMREILGQLYEDKAYFERILDGTARDRGLSDMLSSVLEDGLKFLYDRVLFWAQSDSLPPAPPHPIPGQVRAIEATQATASDGQDNENDGSTEEDSQDERDSNDEIMAKVTDAIDAVSSVNEPGTTGKKKKRLKVRKRRADVLKKRASMVVVPRKKPKKSSRRKSIAESHDEEEENMDASNINFQFNSLAVLGGIGESGKGSPTGGTTTMDESDLDTSMDDAMERQLKREEKRRKRMEKKEKRERQRREVEEKLREKEVQRVKEGGEQEQAKQNDPLLEYLDKMMDSMEELYQKMEYGALKAKAESFLLTMEKYDKSVTGDKMNYVAKAHSYLGNAYVGLKNYDFAIMHFEKDKEIGERWQMPDCVSRSLGNTGRVYVYKKKYAEALKYLALKTKMANSPKENAWLYHEIASCFLQLHHYQFARDAASKSFQAAAEINDTLYQLQSSVLLGAIEVKLQNFERAYGSFERAMDHARLRDDKRAQQAITAALAEVNDKIAREAKLKKLLQEQHEQEMLRKQQQQQAEQEDNANTENGAEHNDGDADAPEKENEEAESGVAESARNTGEDPELTGLTESDDEKGGEGSKEEGDGKESAEVDNQKEDGDDEDKKENGDAKEGTANVESNEDGKDKNDNEVPVVKSEGENGEADKKEDGSKDATVGSNAEDEKDKEEVKKEDEKNNKDEKSDENLEVKADDEKIKAENAENVEEKNVKSAEEKQESEASSKNANTKADESTKADGNANEKEEASEPNAEGEEKVEKPDEATSSVDKDKEEEKGRGKSEKKEEEATNPTVSIVVTEESDKKEVDKKDKKEEEKKEKEKEKDTLAVSEKSSDEGSDITYKVRPITQESLSKSMNADNRGARDGLRKSVVSLNEAVRESETRQGSRKPESIEASTKKKVTISDEPEVFADDEKKKKDEEETRKMQEEEQIPEEPRGKDRVCDKVQDELVLMERDYADKKFDDVLKRGNELMKMLKKLKNIDGWSRRRLMNFAKLHSFMGSASSEKQNFDKARMHHNADLKIGEVIENNFIQARALEHLGRTFIFENKHEKALEFFARRAHLPRNSEVTARLFHEIANSFFQLKAYEFAKDAAMVSLKAANQGGHSMFQLQSSVLIGVTKVKLMRTDAAYSTFQEALNFAVIRDDENAADAIRQAMAQIETKVATDVKNKWLQKVKDSKAAKSGKEIDQKENKKKPKEDAKDPPAVEPSKTVIDVLQSMNEEDKNQEVIDETEEDNNNNDTNDKNNNDGDTEKNKGSETSRTDKSGFLVAPEGPMDKHSNVDKLVKMSKESDTDQGGPKPKRKRQPKPANTAETTTKTTTTTNNKTQQQNDPKKKSNPKTANTASVKSPKTPTNKNTKDKQAVKPSGKDGAKKEDNKEGMLPENMTSKNGVEAVEANLTKAASSREVVKKKENQSSDDTKEEAETQEGKSKEGENESPMDMKAENADKQENAHEEEAKPTAENSETNQKESKQKETSKKSSKKEEAAMITQEKKESDKKNKDKNVQKETQPNTSEKNEEEAQSGESSQTKSEEQQEELVSGLEPIKEDGNMTDVENTDNNAATGGDSKKDDTTPRAPIVKKRRISLLAQDQAEKPPMKRRPSQRFVGLDPKKVAESKSNPQKEQEKAEPPPKPKLPRFVGITPRKENAKEDMSSNKSPREAQNNQNSKGNRDEPKKSKKDKEGDKVPPLKLSEGQDKESKETTLGVPTHAGTSETENSPSPDKTVNDQNDNNTGNSDGYDANLPNEPMITLNDEIGLVRANSITSRMSGTRPATRMSLADMVKDDKPPAEESKTSKAELSALNAMVKESIKQDKKELKKIKQEQIDPSKAAETESPRKAAKNKETNAVIQRYKIEEMRREAAQKRARRQRFLRNRKQSFIMMLTSPYSEVSSVTGCRKLSYDFVKYRRSMADANLSLTLHEDGTYYEDYVHTKHGNSNLPWRNDKEFYYGNDMSSRKAMAIMKGRGNRKLSNNTEDSSQSKNSENVLESIENYLQKDVAATEHAGASGKMSLKAKHRKAEENRISKEIELAARQMRRQEREDRRDERMRLEKEERKRRKDEQEERDLMAIMSNKPTFDNPYDKKPGKVPDLDQRDRFNDDDEKRWIKAQERKILREKRRSKREAEILRRQEEEKRKRKAAMKTPKDRSPRSRTDDAKYKSPSVASFGEKSIDVTPELKTPRVEEEEEEQQKEEEGVEMKEEKQAEEEREKKEEAPEDEKDEVENKEDEDAKAGEKKEDKDAKAEEKKEDMKEEEKNEEQEEAPQPEEEEEEEEAEVEEDDFDGYNDSEEDDDDLVAVYIEKEVRQMRADYNVGKVQEVVDRGTNLLKALRKHTDIVSWSRRRLRWFAAAHTYMGSGHMDLKDWSKATSHHRADYRIGEALEDNKIQSRALEHLARVSIFEGNTPKALEHLAKRAHLPRTPDESARIYHEMANCFFQLGALEYSRDAAVESLQAAKQVPNCIYTLQSTLLLAVCQSKLSDFDSASNSFEAALSEARKLDDKNTISAIEDAKKQLEMRRAATVRDKWKQKIGGGKSVITEPISETDETAAQESARSK